MESASASRGGHAATRFGRSEHSVHHRVAIHGASDNQGAEVSRHPVHPADVLATMWRQLGVRPNTLIYDRLARPNMISSGRVIDELL